MTEIDRIYEMKTFEIDPELKHVLSWGPFLERPDNFGLQETDGPTNLLTAGIYSISFCIGNHTVSSSIQN